MEQQYKDPPISSNPETQKKFESFCAAYDLGVDAERQRILKILDGMSDLTPVDWLMHLILKDTKKND